MAQDDDPSKYFDDKPRLKNAMLVKVIYDPFQSGYYLALEHESTPDMGIEYGLGIVSNVRQFKIMDWFYYPIAFTDQQYGKVGWISARLYKYGYAERLYLGAGIWMKSCGGYMLPSMHLIYGFQRPLINHLAYDLNFQFGPALLYKRNRNNQLFTYEFVDLGPSFQLQAKLAYIF